MPPLVAHFPRDCLSSQVQLFITTLQFMSVWQCHSTKLKTVTCIMKPDCWLSVLIAHCFRWEERGKKEIWYTIYYLRVFQGFRVLYWNWTKFIFTYILSLASHLTADMDRRHWKPAVLYAMNTIGAKEVEKWKTLSFYLSHYVSDMISVFFPALFSPLTLGSPGHDITIHAQ